MQASFPSLRLRRLRSRAWCRDLVAESSLEKRNLIMPFFVSEKAPASVGQDHSSFHRVTLLEDLCAFVEKKVLPVGIHCVALFPAISSEKKDKKGSEALNEKGLIPQAIKKLRKAFPDLGIISDIALDTYTSHGHDGVLDKDVVDNDATIQWLVKMACVHAEAGVDFLGLSDMMDGRVGVIRSALEKARFYDTKILSYAAKYASHLYKPYRQMVGSSPIQGSLSKKTYQMDYRNGLEALREAALDIQEGADVLMVKPGGFYLDVVQNLSRSFQGPVWAFQVSGEFAMLRAGAEKGFFSYEDVLMESLYAFKRAGASAVITYGALDAAKILST